MQLSQDLVDELTRLPAQPVAAIRVLRMVEDPRASAADLARIIEADPALSARVMRLANSPYYGLSRRVGSAGRAVVLLGFTTVRALAVGGACALLAEQGRLGPRGFWSHSVTTAVASSVVARKLGASASDAFSLGLLHDLGSALLFRHHGERYERLALDAVAGGSLVDAEREAYGADHAALGAAVLESWRFPQTFVRAVAEHHEDQPAATLGRTLRAGAAMAASFEGEAGDESPDALAPALDVLGLHRDKVPGLLHEVQRESDALARFLGVG